MKFAAALKDYRITKVVGDRFGGEWPRERFRIHGINYECADMAKTDLYQVLLPLINSRAVDLLDHDRLVHQMVGLERRAARGGRDTIDHGRGGHDDVCNAVAGAVVIADPLPAGWRRREVRGLGLSESARPSNTYSDPVNPGTNWMARR
jgi:hypothetical protein